MGMPSSEEIKHDPSFHQLVVDQTLSFLPSAGRSFARRLRCVSQAHASAPHMDGEDETERQLAPVSRQDKRRGRSPSVHVHQAGFDSTDPGQAATTPCPVKSPSSCRAATTATAARRTARHLPRRPCQPSSARVKRAGRLRCDALCRAARHSASATACRPKVRATPPCGSGSGTTSFMAATSAPRLGPIGGSAGLSSSPRPLPRFS
jgi:hypothetical protein